MHTRILGVLVRPGGMVWRILYIHPRLPVELDVSNYMMWTGTSYRQRSGALAMPSCHHNCGFMCFEAEVNTGGAETHLRPRSIHVRVE